MAIPAKVGEAFVEIKADFSRFNQQINTMSARMQQVGQRLKSSGQAMTQAITAPLAAASGIASSFAADFDQSLQKVQSTAALTGKQTEQIGQAAERMAIGYGKSTDKIFAGLQKAISSQLEFNQAVDAGDAAAKAAAAGFGSMEENIITATTAMEVFSGLDTAQGFFDQLISVARQSQVQVEQLGNAFRRNANTASQLGLGFKETLSVLASVSEQVGSTTRGGRLLQQVLTGLLDPSSQAADVLDKVGMTVEGLQNKIQKKGLTTALTDLQSRLEENNMGLEDFFGSSRRLEGALTIVNDEGRRTKEIMEDAGDAQGTLNEAFDESDNSMRDLSKVWQELKAAFRDFGQAILPVVIPLLKDFADFIKKVANAFSEMPNDNQEMFVRMGAALAALGPALIVVGQAFIGLAGILSTVVAIFSGIGPAFAALAAILTTHFLKVWDTQKTVWENLQILWKQSKNIALTAWKTLKQAALSVFTALQSFWESWGGTITKIMNRLGKMVQRFIKNGLKALKVTTERVLTLLGRSFDSFGEKTTSSLVNIIDKIATLIEQSPKIITRIGKMTKKGGKMEKAFDTLVFVLESMVSVIKTIIKWTNKLLNKLRSVSEKINSITQFTPLGFAAQTIAEQTITQETVTGTEPGSALSNVSQSKINRSIRQSDNPNQTAEALIEMDGEQVGRLTADGVNNQNQSTVRNG